MHAFDRSCEGQAIASQTERDTRRLRLSVIVPTYCEAANLAQLVPRVTAAIDKSDCAGEVIVVDDNSPDGTQDLCRELSLRYPLRLEVRRDVRGLSSAVLHGMKIASGDVLVVMDADLSHPPEAIPQLVAALIDEDLDVVIGSRYVDGGATEKGWGLFRWLNSRFATLIALPLTSVRDPMAGFFATRRKTILEAGDLDPIGYKILLEILVKSRKPRIKELPIIFQNRLHGESKLSLREQVNYLRHIRRLYAYKIKNWVGRTGR